MENQKTENTCSICIERLIDREPLSQDFQKHVISCKSCKAVINTMGAIALQGSAYSEDLSGLKLQLMKKLVPLMSATKSSKMVEASGFSKVIPWFLSFAVVGAMLVMFGVFNPGVINKPCVKNASTQIASVSTFKIALNSEKEKLVSLDEPIVMTNNDKAVITIPDGSQLEVQGPARLNINPRGFHLVTGFVTAKVKKSKIPFISTTPHGQIRVLGTIYTCKVAKSKTTVSLKRGSVKVIPDYGRPVVLKPGESTSFSLSPKNKPETETIPPIDSE